MPKREDKEFFPKMRYQSISIKFHVPSLDIYATWSRLLS